MKLTKTQIQQLYAFTEKHFVEWYDVQTELVDHLANGIEEQMTKQPSLTFQSALNSEFKKFGVMGFNDVVAEKTKALNSYYRNRVWYFFKSYFKLPKIILTTFFIWVYFKLITSADYGYWVIGGTFIIMIFVPIIFHIRKIRRIKSIEKQTNKKWLFHIPLQRLGELSNLVNVISIYCFIIPESDLTWNTITSLIFSIFIVIFALVFYISIFIVYPKFQEEQSLQYSEYKFA